MSVNRYYFKDGYTIDSKSGNWVHWEDYEALQKRYDELFEAPLVRQLCTPAERAVLDAWEKVPEELLRVVHKMPIHLFQWLLVPCEAELARRQGKI